MKGDSVMKKFSALFLVLILVAGCLCPVFAAGGPQKPEITGNGPYCYLDVGDEVHLWVDAESKDGGTLTYQWYSTTVDDITTIRAIDGATSKEYSYKATKGGITFFCCGVWNNVGGVQSEPVYSRLIRVWISPMDPVIDSTGPDVHMKVGSETGVWCQATVGEQGTLTYQWYKTNVNDITTIRAIDGATSSDLDLKQDYPEVAYYCCAVWNNINGKQSDPVYSRLIRVEFFDPEPAVPVITGTGPDVHMKVNDETAVWCDAKSQDGGTLTYQWYSSDTNDISTIRAIDGATQATYEFKKDQPELKYYCCGVWNNKDGKQSAPVYSRMVRVEIFSDEPDPPETETVQATDIGFFDLSDGEKLTATQPDYNNPGTQIMILSYEGVSDTFEITVKAKEAPVPDPNQNTTPDPGQNTAPDPGQNTAPDPNQNTVPEPNNGGEKKSAGFVPYVCAAAGVIVGGAAVYFITRKKK